MGLGPWTQVQDQALMNDGAIEQLRCCCVRAWERIESQEEKCSSFQKVIQGPKEPYTDFIARLQKAVKRQKFNLEAVDTILQLLAYENANSDCKKLIAPFKGKRALADYIKLCQGVRTETYKADLLAQAMAALNEKLLTLQALVEEQIEKRHIEESHSPWNSPVFVIKKKIRKMETFNRPVCS